MSTLRVSNIEAKADASSPTVNEKLKVTNSNGDVLIHVNGETSGITTIGINTTGESVRFDSNQNVTFSGKIGIGTDNPKSGIVGVAGLHVYRGASGQTGTNSANLVIEHSADAEIALLCPSTNVGRIKFGDNDDANRGQIRYDHTDDSMQFTLNDNKEKLRITSTGDVNVAAGGSVFIANGNLVFQTSGTGIDFQNAGISSTTSSAHLLDDYEEGTWTPTYVGSTGNPTITYTVQQGVYTKIGNTIHCQGRLQTSAASGGSGAVLIGNFPFECKTGNDRGVLNVGYSNDWVTQAPETGHMENGGTNAFLRYFSGNGTPTIVVGSNLRNVGAGDNDLMFDVTYEVV